MISMKNDKNREKLKYQKQFLKVCRAFLSGRC